MEHGCSGFSDEAFIRATELRGCEEINFVHGRTVLATSCSSEQRTARMRGDKL